jgi:hypothetical protein
MKSRIVIVLFLSLVLVGCKKNQLKKPTDVSFKMDVDRTPSPQGHLEFNDGSIFISEFDVEGTRKEGEPIAFNKTFSQGLSISFDPNQNIPELVFDIPQGDYEELVITFSTKYNGGNSNLSVSGTYTNGIGTSYPLLYEFKDEDEISIIGEDDEGDATIVLDKDISASALIQFDPVYWFGMVSNNLLDNADLVNVGGQQTILINSSTNEDIYDLVVDRMEETAMALWGD